jgi:hypothetical protein
MADITLTPLGAYRETMVSRVLCVNLNCYGTCFPVPWLWLTASGGSLRGGQDWPWPKTLLLPKLAPCIRHLRALQIKFLNLAAIAAGVAQDEPVSWWL